MGVRFESGGAVSVVDTKDERRPALSFSDEEWAAFLVGVKNGEFDPAD